jgi:hypothetical protein
MEILTEFAEKIVILMIILSALINLSAGTSYEKYIRLVAGMLITAYMLSQAVTLWNYALDLGTQTTDYEAESIMTMAEVRDEALYKITAECMREEILNSLITAGYKINEISCDYNGNDYYFYVTADANDQAGIKKYLIDFYHIDEKYIILLNNNAMLE